jgi:hypothetical protein
MPISVLFDGSRQVAELHSITPEEIEAASRSMSEVNSGKRGAPANTNLGSTPQALRGLATEVHRAYRRETMLLPLFEHPRPERAGLAEVSFDRRPEVDHLLR